MKSLYESFCVLERLLNEEHVFLNPGLSFPDLCSWLAVKEEQMDSLLLDELGMNGRALMESLRKSMPERMERKYGIKVPAESFF